MALPITIPNTFANATASIPLANLDANFVTVTNAINGIGNGSEALANVNITGGSIVNVTGIANAQVNIIAGTGLTGGGNLTANVSLAIANTAVSPGTFGGGTNAAQVTVDQQGRITSAANVAIPQGTVTNVATGTGLTGGPVTSTGTISLANTAVNPNTYGNATNVPQITVDAQGRITSASNVAISTSSGTVTNVATGTGLTGGPITSTGTVSIANTTVAAGTYGNANTVSVFTVNAQGQLTSASNTAIAIGTAQVTGLGTIATQSASNVAITGGSFSNVIANNTNRELVTINANGAANTINYDVKTQQVLLYTGNATANVTINIRGDGSTTLNDTMANNQSLTVAFAMTNNATARYVSLTQIDGSNVTPKWQGGAPTSGTANSTEVYVYNVIKTGTSTYTVLASKTAFT
jgi:hypothetical protein